MSGFSAQQRHDCRERGDDHDVTTAPKPQAGIQGESCGGGAQGGCQTNSNQSLFALTRSASGRTELPPLGKSGGTVLLEIGSALKVALAGEMAVDR